MDSERARDEAAAIVLLAKAAIAIEFVRGSEAWHEARRLDRERANVARAESANARRDEDSGRLTSSGSREPQQATRPLNDGHVERTKIATIAGVSPATVGRAKPLFEAEARERMLAGKGQDPSPNLGEGTLDAGKAAAHAAPRCSRSQARRHRRSASRNAGTDATRELDETSKRCQT